jgi:hypothetical protein
MKKVFILISMMISLLADIFTQKELTIKSINDEIIKVKEANLIVGNSGIVVHHYDKSHSSILANIVVVSSDDSGSVLSYHSFDNFHQDSLPKTTLKISKDDKVILNHLHNNAIIIAPNADMLKLIQDKYKDRLMIIHSDQLGSYLAVEQLPQPTKDDFMKFCNDRAIGIIFFVLKEKVYILDSKTFAVLQSYNHNQNISKFNKPFYTRVEEIKSAPLSTTKPIKDYQEYYKTLITQKN